MIHLCQTGIITLPNSIGRIFAFSKAPHTLAPQVVKGIIDSFDPKGEPCGSLLVKDVTDAYELGTVMKGDDALIST